MKKLIVLFTALLYTMASYAQNTLSAIVKDAKTHEPLIGATAIINSISLGTASDTSGLVILQNIPNGKYVIQFSYIGYKSQTDTLDFPLPKADTLLIFLNPANEGSE